MSTLKVEVNFDLYAIRKILNSESYRKFCDSREDCKHCPLFYFNECEESYDAIKKEYEK